MRWIIGDIHGMLPPLERLLDEIGKRDMRPRLLFCGDYVNRGPESRRVVDLLLSLPNAAFCRGNHDDTFDLLMTGESYVPHLQINIATTFDHFMKYGLQQTLESYSIEHKTNGKNWHTLSPGRIREMLSTVPAAHRKFFHELPGVLHEPEFFVAHARWNPTGLTEAAEFDDELSRSPQARHDVIWGRFTNHELAQTKTWDRTGFFGHTPVTMYRSISPLLPVEAEQIILLDTAAAVHEEGRLTAWCYEEARFVQVDRDGELSL